MNVCILKESLCIGGTERSAANTSKALNDQHNVHIALYDASQTNYTYSGKLIDFKLPPKPSIVGKVINTVLRDIKLRRLINRYSIDILYTFTGITNRQTHYKYKTTKIISARDFGGMYANHKSYKMALNNSAAMICNSEYTKNYYLSHYPEDEAKVFTVYNYIDIKEICKQSNDTVENEYISFINSHKNTIVSAGRFCREKGFEFLLEAFARAKETDQQLGLVLIGDGDPLYKERYEKIINKYNLNNDVYLTGFQDNPYKYMSKCSCFVLSSLSEGFPNVLAEAMALGLPVIATNCYSGPAEILRKDKDYNAVTNEFVECDFGIVTPKMTDVNNDQSIYQLSRAIHTLLSDDDKKLRYCELSKKRVLDFSMEATGRQLNDIFDELLKKRCKRHDKR